MLHGNDKATDKNNGQDKDGTRAELEMAAIVDKGQHVKTSNKNQHDHEMNGANNEYLIRHLTGRASVSKFEFIFDVDNLRDGQQCGVTV